MKLSFIYRLIVKNNKNYRNTLFNDFDLTTGNYVS